MSAHVVARDQLPSLTGEFLSSLEAEGRAARTARCYRSDLKHLADYLATVGSPLDRQAAAEYEAWLRRNRPAAAATQHRRLAVARRFIGYLAHTAQIDDDFADAVQPLRPRPGLAAPPSRDDVRVLLEAPGPGTQIGRRDRVMFSLMAFHGLRPREVCSLRWRDFDPEAHTLSVPGRARAFTIHDRYLAEDLSRLKAGSPNAEPNGPIFLSRRGGALTTCGLAQRVQHYCGLLGDRLQERLTARRLRDFAVAEAARRAGPEEMAELAAELGYEDLASARRCWRQVRERLEEMLLQDLMPIEQAASTSGVDAAKLREWVGEGIPHRIADDGQVMVSLAAVQEWGSRPAPGGRAGAAAGPASTGEGEQADQPLPPIVEALLRLMGVTTREEFHDALEALPETDIPRAEPDVRAELERIGRQFLGMAVAVDGALDHNAVGPRFLTYVAALLKDIPQAHAALAGGHQGLDETFAALRDGLIQNTTLLRAHDAAVRMAYGHDQRLLAVVERRFASGEGPSPSREAPARHDAASDGSSVEPRQEPGAREPLFQQLALQLLDTPQSFSMWRELQPGSASAGLVLMIASLFRERLVELAPAAADYYGLPEDDRTGLAAWGALMHAFLTGVICACPEAVQALRQRTGSTSGAAMLVLEHVKVHMLALWSAAELLPKSEEGYLLSAPRLLDLGADEEFCELFESRWREAREYARGPWDYLVVPKLGVTDLLRYHNLVFGAGELGSVSLARENCDYLVYLTKASPQVLLLSTGEGTVRQFVLLLYGIFAPLVNSRHRKMLLSVADLTGSRARDLTGLVSADLPLRVRRRVSQLWKAFDFARGSFGADDAAQPRRGRTSFAAYLRAGLHRLFRREHGKLLRAVMFAPGSLEALDSEEDDEQTVGAQEEPQPRGAGHREVVPLGSGEGALRPLAVVGPDGEEYLTTYWAAVRAGCTDRQLRSLDAQLKPLRLHQVFPDQLPEDYSRLPRDTRLYPRRNFQPHEIRGLLFRRKHRCGKLPEGYWTRGAVAAKLECTPPALIYWEQKGELQPVRIAGRVAYDEEQAAKAAELIGREPTAEDEPEERALYEDLMMARPGMETAYDDEHFEGLTIIEPPHFP